MKKKTFFKWVIVWGIIMAAAGSPVTAAEGYEEPKRKQEIDISSKHGILMEVSTGEILFEKDAHNAAAPASVTKIMTMLLIFDALEEGKIKIEDMVTVSERAASMGGSQVYLEQGEKQTVDTMLKCIAVASANDACVAMAEHLSGSEEQFVNAMNERAKGLGMKNTAFKNCNGLDTQGHVISAHDVALMSRELLAKYPQIHDYCTVWTEDITHVTAKGSSRFGLANTNKLLRQYEYCTGLKTGSTADAGFCVSASAKKGELELIAVIMNGETSKQRFSDARNLLEYGFAAVNVYRDTDKERENLPPVPVTGGIEESVLPVYEKEFSCLLRNKENPLDMKREIKLNEKVKAPVKKGDKLGTLAYYYGKEKIGEVHILASKDVSAADYMDYVKKVWLAWMM